jgi:two-component system, OmpR family, KDP operon response regulator KdpE
MTRVLVVDDEPQMVRALRITLKARGYEVDTAEDGQTAIAAASENPPELVILDLGLPDMDGVDVIAALRGWSRAPIVVLSGRTSSDDKVEALDAGADDYVTKPFAMDELLARMRAVVRRAAPEDEQPRVEIGECVVDLSSLRAVRTRSGVAEDVRLTPTEWRVLEVLVRNPGRLVTQRQLLTEVWGPAYVRETGYLRLYLAQLRRKLEIEPSRPRHLVTEAGIGYRFMP